MGTIGSARAQFVRGFVYEEKSRRKFSSAGAWRATGARSEPDLPHSRRSPLPGPSLQPLLGHSGGRACEMQPHND